MRKFFAAILLLQFALQGCAHNAQHKSARKKSECTLKENPEEPAEYLCNARILSRMHLYPEAVEVLLRGMKRWGESPAFLKELAGILKKAGLKEEAEKYLKRAKSYETAQGKKGR